VSATLLIDNSAWARLGHPELGTERSEEIASELQAGRIGVCLPFLLEAGCSTRSPAEHGEILAELLSLPFVSIDERIERRALDAQHQLAKKGHHRIPPVDILIAALGEVHGLGILHYDGDYELILGATDLGFQSVWLVERGGL